MDGISALQGCNILVTGATGLIGSAFVDCILSHKDLDCTVYASGRNEAMARKRFTRYAHDNRFQFITYDVTQPLECNVDFHYVVHAASYASPNFFVKNPVEVMLSNINGVKNLVEYGIRHQMRRFLYISSGEVYGQGDGRAFSEKYQGYVDINSPRSCYPSSKRAAETLCASYAAEYNIDYVIARPSHVYGPRFTESDNRVYSQFIRNVLDGKDVIMKSTGSQVRSWCYVEDCASALLYILLRGESGQAYNVSDTTAIRSILQLAEMVASIGGRQVIMDLDDSSMGQNPVTKSVLSTEKLEHLGWTIQGTMEEKMAQTIHEIQQNNEQLG